MFKKLLKSIEDAKTRRILERVDDELITDLQRMGIWV